jgi:DNA helicase-2/ATP-dependent DNA helicase PcrA
MWQVLENAVQFGFKSGTLEAIQNFVIMIQSCASMLKTTNAYDVAVHVGKQTNLVKELFNDKSTEGVARYENIQELLNSIKEWVDTQQNLSQIDEDGTLVETSENEAVGGGEINLGAYLQQITLHTDADDKDPNADTVKMMTIHAAKGLEFSCVFAAGLEEMLFPSGLSINTREELEEERRLFYVVITRAKKKLWITYANTRYRFGQVVQNEPSRFLDELPGDYVDRTFAGNAAFKNQGFTDRSNANAFDRMHGGGWGGGGRSSSAEAEKRYGPPPSKKPAVPSYVSPKPAAKAVEHVPSADFVASDTTTLKEGQKVEHQKFGFGVVLKMEGSAHNPVATVKFDVNGEKKIMLNYAKLRIIE